MITIRPYMEDDIDDLYEAASESSELCYEFLPWCHPTYSHEDASTFVMSRAQAWDEQSCFSFAIIDQASLLYLGGTSVHCINWTERFARLDCWVRTSALGRGVGEMALQLTAEYLFEHTDLMRLECVVSVEDEHGLSVAKQAGALNEGVLRDRLYLHEQPHDAHMLAFLKRDFPI